MARPLLKLFLGRSKKSKTCHLYRWPFYNLLFYWDENQKHILRSQYSVRVEVGLPRTVIAPHIYGMNARNLLFFDASRKWYFYAHTVEDFWRGENLENLKKCRKNKMSKYEISRKMGDKNNWYRQEIGLKTWLLSLGTP